MATLLERRAALVLAMAKRDDNPKQYIISQLVRAGDVVQCAASLLAYVSKYGKLYRSALKGADQPLLDAACKLARVSIETHKQPIKTVHRGAVCPLYQTPPPTDKAHADHAAKRRQDGKTGSTIRFEPKQPPKKKRWSLS